MRSPCRVKKFTLISTILKRMSKHGFDLVWKLILVFRKYFTLQQKCYSDFLFNLFKLLFEYDDNLILTNKFNLDYIFISKFGSLVKLPAYLIMSYNLRYRYIMRKYPYILYENNTVQY